MAIPAFIAANPGLSLSAVSLLSKLGSGLLGRNDAKDAMTKAEEENRKIMAQANLRQSFGGNPSVDLVQPKLDPGLGTTLLSKLGDAAGLASTAYGLYDANKLRNLQMDNVQGQIDARKLTTQTAQEAADRARLLQQGAGQYAQDVAGQVRGVQQGPSLGSKMPSFGGPSISSPPLGSVAQQGYSQAATAAADRLRAGQLDEARLQKLLAETGKLTTEAGKIAAETRGLDPTILTYDDSITRATPLVESLAKTRTPWSEVTTSPSLSKIHPEAFPQLRAAYDAEAAKVIGETNKGVSDYLFGDIRQLASGNAMIKKGLDLPFGANLLVTGWEQQNGAGDLQLVTASVRLGDPGMGVRPAEAAQWEEAGGIVQGWLVYGERFKEGDRFKPEVRNKLLKAGLDQYKGNMGLIDQSVTRLQDTATPRILQLTGSTDIGTVAGVGEFFDNYRLPPLEDYAKAAPNALEAYRKMGAGVQPSGTVGDTHRQVLNFLETYKPGLMPPGTGSVLRRNY